MDTNVFVSALNSADGGSREIIRRCLDGRDQVVLGLKQFCELEDVLSREQLFNSCPLDKPGRKELFDAFIASAELIPVYYLWRPNLPDEGDNHLIEVAVAASADAIVTHNVSDFRRNELKFDFEILTPKQFLNRSK